jgi:hypothetical protein
MTSKRALCGARHIRHHAAYGLYTCNHVCSRPRGHKGRHRCTTISGCLGITSRLWICGKRWTEPRKRGKYVGNKQTTR